MGTLADEDLYVRGIRTLLASWDEYARGAHGAHVLRFPGVAAAVFPHHPDRAVYNNALVDRGLTTVSAAEAIDALESAYAQAEVTQYAVWVDEDDAGTRDHLQSRGHSVDTTTCAMGLDLDDLEDRAEADIDLDPPDWPKYRDLLAEMGAPPGLLGGVDTTAFDLLIARLGERAVATALGYEYDGDCGIYNVSTLEHARRRGLGTALSASLVRRARARGCRSATLQSTPIAEGVYTAIGFRAVGRIYEYVPN